MHFPVGLSATGIAMTLATDLAQITVADDRPITVAGLIITQSSDVGDAAEEVLRWGLYRGVTTGSTGGTSLTVTPLQQGGPTPSVTGTTNWTTASTGGTLMLTGGFNIRVGQELWFPPECRPYVGQAGSPFSFRLLAAPADSVTIDISVILLEG